MKRLTQYEIDKIDLRLGTKEEVTLTRDEATWLLEYWDANRDSPSKYDHSTLQGELNKTLSALGDRDDRIESLEDDLADCRAKRRV